MTGRPVDRIGLGELTEAFPPELVDAVPAKSQAHAVRVRLLPPRLMAYFALARALSRADPYREVPRTLAEAARHQNEWGKWRVPDKASVFRARRTLGVEAGTHVICDAAVDSHRGKERVAAERLAGSLRPACSPWLISTCPTVRGSPPSGPEGTAVCEHRGTSGSA